MKKNKAIKQRSSVTGRVVTKPLGKNKAAKFSEVEGMAISEKSAETLSNLEKRGLKGDALRSAVSGSFVEKRG